MQGRDPRDAWAFTQRICGVCTVVHAVASCRAGRGRARTSGFRERQHHPGLVHGMQFIQDHVIHFYHLHSTGWTW